MKVLNFGSLNIDHVFQVAEIVRPGQTIDFLGVENFPGGKGMNQSVAIARAGCRVYHAGNIGPDGQELRGLLEEAGADCTWLRTVEVGTGSTFIQVDANGQNCIVLNGGANRANSREYCDEVLAHFDAGDLILLQNEINCVDYLIEKAHEKGMVVALNPSPMNEKVLACDLSRVSLFIMNEDEGMSITGKQEPEEILAAMAEKFPEAQVVLTLGSKGSVYQGGGRRIRQKAYHVKAVDTTAAGDTFTGFLLAGMARGEDMAACLDDGARASAIAVTRMGATSSIPTLEEVRATALEA